MKPFAILASDKYYSISEVINAISHDQRLRPVLNANSAINNYWAIGNCDDDLKKKFIERINKIGKIQKNAIYAHLLILSASPTAFRKNNPWKYGLQDKEFVKKFNERVREWAIKKFGDMVLYMVCHLDEATCHIHLMIIPIVSNRLSHNKVLGGHKSNLTKLIDDFSEHMSPLGLKRGRRFSEAEHQNVQWYYELVNQHLEQLPEFLKRPVPPEGKPSFPFPVTKVQRQAAGEYDKKMKQYQIELDLYNSKLPGDYEKLCRIVSQHTAKAIFGDAAKEKIDRLLDRCSELSVQIDALKKQLHEQSPTNLHVVLKEFFGYELSQKYKYFDHNRLYWSHDKENYIEADIQQHRWSLDSGVSGRGALTLVSRLLNPNNPSIDDGLRFLKKMSGDKKANADYLLYLESIKKRQDLTQVSLPIPKLSADSKDTKNMMHYFCDIYNFPEPLVRQLLTNNKLSVNSAGNIVFPSDSNNGYYYRSIEEATTGKPRRQRIAPKESEFLYSLAGQNRTIVIVADPMEVIAVKAIDPMSNVVCFSNPTPDLLHKNIVGMELVICALGIESEKSEEYSLSLKTAAENAGIEFTDNTVLKSRKRYSSWSKYLKDKPTLLGAGVLIRQSLPSLSPSSGPRM